ncbi:MAG TPA: nitroreductase/quinone reductase family protein [Methylomirabilota bacterium]|jgi:deazaflavin-dependent oxidoreductase (nitroreductase family)|nr:nitroreductase/quinone reductase family protein [Methylomirabilota bacterium]
MNDAPSAWAETEFFRALNALVEPAVRAGCGSPGLLPTGMIVLETTGVTSGQPRRVPLLATIFDGCVFVSTALGPRARWVKNLTARPEVRYWVGGREQRGRARVFAPGVSPPSTTGLPPFARAVADGLLPPATAFGWTFAVITPDRE